MIQRYLRGEIDRAPDHLLPPTDIAEVQRGLTAKVPQVGVARRLPQSLFDDSRGTGDIATAVAKLRAVMDEASDQYRDENGLKD